MEDIEQPEIVTEEERQLRQWKQELKEKRITQAKRNVVKKQLTEAYEIIDNIRFDYIGDTAFRDKVTDAKKGIESALCDFLLSDHYHETKRKEHQEMSPKGYDEFLKSLEAQGDQN